jgi:hypothetical protein
MANRNNRTRNQGGGATRTAERSRSTQGSRMTKAERKEEARRQREVLLRRQERARRIRMLVYVTLGAAALAVVVSLLIKPKQDATAASPSALPGMLTTDAPWPANTGDLSARLKQLSLPPEGGAMHVHSNLAIFVDGKPVTVPADIGLAADAQSPLHTHDTSGVVHVESADPGAPFTLGQFFDVWGVRLSGTCIGGYCASGNRTLQVFVNGKPAGGNPSSISLDPDKQDIVIAFGTPGQVPDPLPTYDWSSFTP